VNTEISQDTDVSTADIGSDPVIVLADFEVEIIQELEQGPPGPISTTPGPPGPPGPQGPQGVAGLPGNQIYYGAANPTPEIGINGDSYINTSTHFLFGPKAAGSWPAGVSIVGPQGPQGIQGVQGVQGIQGIPGNTVLYGINDPQPSDGIDGNFFINQISHFIFGPKASGAWPAGTSMIGPQGAQGIQGPVGPSGPVPEAPNDGQQYVRQSLAWAVAGGFVAGTVMLFYQAAAPTGWTKLTTQNDKALRVVSGAGGVAGGTNAFSTVMAQTVVGGFTASLATTASHSHNVNPGGGQISFMGQFTSSGGWANPAAGTSLWAQDGTGPSGGGGAHNHPIMMAIQYCDVILASKN
jgi:hypothetical protein